MALANYARALREKAAARNITAIVQFDASKIFPWRCDCGMAYGQEYQLNVHLFRMEHGLSWPYQPEILEKKHRAA